MGIDILNGFDKDKFDDKHIKLWSAMKALLPENDDFLNSTVQTWKPVWLLSVCSVHYISIYKVLIQNHVNKLKDSKQDSLLLVYKYLNFVGPSRTILSVLAKVVVVCRYFMFCAKNALSARNRVDTVYRASCHHIRKACQQCCISKDI